MHAVTYEWRRLTGVRSTWLIVAATLAAETALDAVTVRHPLIGSQAPMRMLTAAVPLLPLPAAALGAGALGALALGQELRHPGVRPLLPTRRRRLRLLLAKLVVNAGVGLLLALAALGLGLALLRFGRPDGAALLAHLARDPGPAIAGLAGYLALVLAAGCTALLAAGVCRSAAAGMLVLVTVFVLLQPVMSVAYQRIRAIGWFRQHLGGLRALGTLHDTAELSPALLAAAVIAPALVLLCAYAALLLRRRGL